jgi:protein SCO1
MILHRLLQITTGVLLGLAVLAVVFLFAPGRGHDPLSAPLGVLEPDPYPAPALSLRNMEGQTVTLREHLGEVTLVFFGFASCPDVCPLTLARWTRALETLTERGGRFQGIFVSVDPGRDTPDSLERWMSHFHPSILALTGSPDEIQATAAAWNVHVRVHAPTGAGAAATDPHAHHRDTVGDAGTDDLRLPPSHAEGEEDYLVEHSSRTFVVDREGRVVTTFPAFLEAEEIVQLLEPLMGS